jgi:exonuclease SbcC
VALARMLEINDSINRAQTELNGARALIEKEMALLEAKVREQEARIARLPALEAKRSQLQKQAEGLAIEESSIGENRHQLQEKGYAIQLLAATNSSLKAELSSLKEKLDLLSEGGAKCPLCETSLEAHTLDSLRRKLQEEFTAKSKTHRNGMEQIARLTSEHKVLDRDIAQQENRLNRDKLENQSQAKTLSREIEESATVAADMKNSVSRIQEIEATLKGDFAPALQQSLNMLLLERQSLAYERAIHDETRDNLAGLQKYESMKQKLSEAEQIIAMETTALKTDIVEAEALHAKCLNLDALALSLERDLKDQPKIAGLLGFAEEALESCQRAERQVGAEVASLEERLRHYDSIEKTGIEKEHLLRQAKEEASIFKELYEAFGKNGVQAIIIEQAIPEIEIEANRLLGKMTDNRMSITLETQREAKAKKGNSIETLDIKIGDELGTRSYEMYSGGESFRINLALRIALSRLLVKRAGASLPILIIDEGFGTQDASGREKLVEAINSIQDDFDKILVITHLEELKEYFPVRINVVKTSSGSTFSVD